MNARDACLYDWRVWAVLWLGLLMSCATLRADALPGAAMGAHVDESQVRNVYYVDIAGVDAADDDKHGSTDAPFSTINYACAVAVRDKERRIGVKVIVAPGVYRETVEIRPPGGGTTDTDAPLVIESAEREQAIIDGADTDGWTSSTWKLDGDQWTHPWPFQRTAAQQEGWARALHASDAPPSALGEAYRPGDLVLVDGNIMRQVNRLEDLAPGCFWGRAVIPSTRATKFRSTPAIQDGPMVLLQPPPDTPLAGSIMQVGVRNHDLSIHGRRNIVIRGLRFEHAAGPAAIDRATAGLLLDDCSNVLVDDVLCQWNDGTGLVIAGRGGAGASTDLTVRQSHFLHNGGSGLRITNVSNLLVEDTEACFNNFRGEWANWVDAKGPAGVEANGVHTAACRRLRAVGNFCRGVCWDGDDTNITLEDASVRGNLIIGLGIEENPGPILIRRCLVAGTKSHPSVREEKTSPAGIAIAATPDVTLEDSISAANAGTQLGVRDESFPAEEIPARNVPVKRAFPAGRHVYHHNVFFGTDETELLYRMPIPMDAGKADPGSYYDTLAASENCFWSPAQTAVFALRGKPSKSGGKDRAVDQLPMSFENWCTLLARRNGSDRRMEVGSLWADPLFADPAEGDLRLDEHSPAANWNLPSDEGSTTP